MANYRILPYYLVNLSAITLPYVEALFGLFLIFQLFTPAVALGLTILMFVFLGALFSAFLRGIDTGCGCFSATAEPISLTQIFRDMLFLVMGIYVYTVALARETTRNRLRSKAF
jgi:putative oxidoreductase